MTDKPQFYRRELLAGDSTIGWGEIPNNIPMEVFSRLMADREREHPEKLVRNMTRQQVEERGLLEYRARVFSELAWGSEKIGKIEPPEWRAEYAWIYSVALIDGTFIAEPARIWAAAYALVRPGWDVAKVALLLDELERVGLLERAKAEDGKVWGRWIKSENFQPKPERIEKAGYKQGRPDLFNIPPRSTVEHSAPPRSTVKHRGARRTTANHGLGVGVGVGVGSGTGTGTGDGQDKGGQGGSLPSSSSQIKVKTEKQEWLDFINNADDLPDSMRYAEPKAEERAAVLAQLRDVGAETLAEAIEEWEEEQSPPLSTLMYGRWTRWLETGGVKLKDKKETAVWEKEWEAKHPKSKAQP